MTRSHVASFVLALLLTRQAAAAGEEHKHEHKQGAQSAAASAPSGESIYQLDLRLLDQAGKTRRFDELRGKPVVVSMFYASCKSMCPMLIDRLRRVSASLPEAVRKDVTFLLVSFDGARDTPAAMTALAATHKLSGDKWILSSTTDRDVQLLAAVLGVKYRRLDGGDFNHNAVISVVAPDGRISFRLDGLNEPLEPVVSAVVAAQQAAR